MTLPKACAFSQKANNSTNSVSLFLPWLLTILLANLYISDQYNQRVRMLDTNGIISTVAGNGDYGKEGAGGDALKAEMNFLEGIAISNQGDLYIADKFNNRICKVAGVEKRVSNVEPTTGLRIHTGVSLIRKIGRFDLLGRMSRLPSSWDGY